MSFEQLKNSMKEKYPEFMKQMDRMDRESEERNRKRDADHKEYMERSRRRSEARHQEHLKEMDEIENGPPIPYPIVSCSIPLPPIQEVVTLKPFPARKMMKERKFPYVYFNWWVKWHLKPVSDLFFLWDPEANEMNEITSSPLPNPESELSFFWTPEEAKEVATKKLKSKKSQKMKKKMKKSPPVEEFCTSTPIPIIETSITSLTLIVTTSITSPHPKDLVYLFIYFMSSPSHGKRKRRITAHKTKAESRPTKPQFSGSCVNKSRQLRPKDRLCGSSWKKKKENRITCHSVHCSPRKSSSWKTSIYRSPQKSRRSMKSSSHQKKPVYIASSRKPISESHRFRRDFFCSWKFRKKKSFYKNLKFKLHSRNPSLRKSRVWKRRKKRRPSKKWLYDVYEWDPGIAIFTTLWNPACFPAGSVRTRGLQRNQWTFIIIQH